MKELTPERWQRLKVLFDETLAVTASRREKFLATACADDPSLRREVVSLIESYERTNSLIVDAPVLGLAANMLVGEEHANTISLGQNTVSPLTRAHSAFPVLDWDRYEIAELIGEGGMGRVYKARDLLLQRHVALKFLRAADPEMVKRFVREAQAQARIEHDNICKVFEVGAVEGKPFIAMQYIEGQPLKRVMGLLTLEQKVKLIKDVALALQAAHAQGLIHRDIKPANIMVEAIESGEWRPYVMDFGLARDVETDAHSRITEGHSRSGTIMGTPSYMAPEQVAQIFGESVRIDHRADLYSLGVTLFELLSGRLPHKSGSTVEVLMRIMQMPPTALREIDDKIPIDLETIVMKCLEKDPAQRYESAKTLADDLQRYIDGEPIGIGQRSITYRVVRHAKKNRAIVAVILAAVLIVMASASMGLYAWWRAQEQSRLAQRLGQEVQEIESIARYGYMLPLHDTQREAQLIRVRLQGIEERMRATGRIGDGPGHYALGRGYLALQEYERAYLHLKLAWDVGYQVPEVSYALGRTLGVLYQRALEETQRIENRELRKSRRLEVEQLYREPALKYMRQQANLPGESSAYVEAVIAFYERRYVEALTKAVRAHEQVPWLYEAKRLEGDIYVAMADDKREVGDYEGAEGYYRSAGDAYRAAAAVGQSDASVYEEDARRWMHVLDARVRSGAPIQEALEQGLTACDRALRANPNSLQSYIRKSTLFRRWADYQSKSGEKPDYGIAQAIETARKAVALAPDYWDTHFTLGSALAAKAIYEFNQGKDPREPLERCIEATREALRINPNSVMIYNNLATAHLIKGGYELEQGLDPRAAHTQAIELYKKALQYEMTSASLYGNLGTAHLRNASYETAHGLDPEPSLNLSIAALKESLQINPNLEYAQDMLAAAYRLKAEYELKFGGRAQTAIDALTESYQQALKRDEARSYIDLGDAYRLKALFEIRQGGNGQEAIKQARDSYEQALKRAPQLVSAYQGLAASFATEASYLLDIGEDAHLHLAQARLYIERALERNGNDYRVHLALGQIELLFVRNEMAHGSAAMKYFSLAEAALKRALQLNDKDAAIYLAMAEVACYRAQYLARQHAPTVAIVEQGLALADKALAIDARMAEALAIQGALHLVASHHAQAQNLLKRALQDNPLLRRRYLPVLDEARRVAAN